MVPKHYQASFCHGRLFSGTFFLQHLRHNSKLYYFVSKRVPKHCCMILFSCIGVTFIQFRCSNREIIRDPTIKSCNIYPPNVAVSRRSYFFCLFFHLFACIKGGIRHPTFLYFLQSSPDSVRESNFAPFLRPKKSNTPFFFPSVPWFAQGLAISRHIQCGSPIFGDIWLVIHSSTLFFLVV